MKVDVFSTDTKYEIVYLDPPWKFGKTGKRKWKPASHYYSTMKIPEIKDLLSQVFRICDKNCLLFMWVVSPEIDKIIKMTEELGFDYITVGFVWHKKRCNVGNYTMPGCELCLIFKKKGGKIPNGRVRNPGTKQFYEESITKHSAKPFEIANMIAKMFPLSKRIELFARDEKDGWDCWGKEV